MPTPTKYTYSLTADFPDDAINSTKLASEIGASSIVTALDRIDVSGDVADVWFKDVLSAGDKTTLDGDVSAPAGGLIAAHDSTPNPSETQSVEVTNQPRMREDGTLYAVPKPSSFGLVMCDRDIRINTCMVTTATAVEDLKMNTATNKEESWGEMSLVGVYKLVAGDMVLCTDQADADANGVLSAWDYHAKAGGNPIAYEVRDGLVYVDAALPANEVWDHRAYAVGAPAIPPAYGGSIALFDAYMGSNPDNTIAALSPQATVLDPGGPGGAAASTVRLYIVHPAGSKLSHVMRLVTYRAPGTF
jgi:hypothetical protein